MSSEKNLTLLIIDRDEFHREACSELLEDEYHVITVSSVNEGIECLKSREVHVILTDTGVPEMLQKQFVREMKGEHSHAVPVVLTGELDLQTVIDAINHGYIFRFVSKPWNPIELKEVLRHAAESYTGIAERENLLKSLEETNRALQKSYDDLAELDRLKTAFMAIASHEIRTPLTLITGFTTLLEMGVGCKEPEQISHSLAKIKEGAKRLERTVKSLFQMVEMGEIKQPLNLESCNPAALMERVIEYSRPFIQERDLDVVFDPDGISDMFLDPAKIEDVFNNLLLNAIKFTPDGGKIEIRTCQPPGSNQIEIEVQDHGVGISDEDLKHIFEPMFSTFSTLHHSSGVYEFQRRGMGLGLAVCKKFVELHDGTIEVCSGESGGTTVKIKLPAIFNP
ncbi:MAG: hybrid sensor histidine kinase/response regulator [Planctomycetota bacterium]|nr:hybrid sensor histidine kinase/response regulator [Planctomycetota bacterium]